jgi:K+-transporting ATPase A subunit
MTIVGWLHIALVLGLVVVAAYPLGSFIADLFEGRRTFLSPVLGPIERGLYRLAGWTLRWSRDGSPLRSACWASLEAASFSSTP